MKKSIFMLGAASLFALASCKKTETTATDVNADSTETAIVVDNDSLPITNDSTINAMDNAAENAVDATSDAIKDGAQSVKEGAENVGNDVKDATDGDGNPRK